ncbi:MAG: hypothetical protein ACI9GW_002971 [Halieaceae bacterium]|jgi:hypothetical protein
MNVSGVDDPPGEIDSVDDDQELEGEEEELSLEDQLQLLLIDHRELDAHIAELQKFAYQDQLELQRLKKKKLQLKDSISYLKDQIIPDWNA